MDVRRISIAVTMALILVTAGIGIGALLMRPVLPQGVEARPEMTSVPVVERQVTDERPAELIPELGEERVLYASTNGLVTALNCTVGTPITSGDHVISVDGQRLHALATRVPLWRELGIGDRGDDVRALQEELSVLGYDIVVDGTLGKATMNAYASLLGQKASDVPLVRPADLVWMPARELTPRECVVHVGQSVATGDTIATAGRALMGMHVRAMPRGLLPGDRVVKVDDSEAAIDKDGVVTDVDTLSRIEGTQSYRDWLGALATQPEAPLHARMVLNDVLPVFAVAPQALQHIDGTHACVNDNGHARAVTIVNSELGQSLVVFDDGAAAPSDLLLADVEASSCQ